MTSTTFTARPTKIALASFLASSKVLLGDPLVSHRQAKAGSAKSREATATISIEQTLCMLGVFDQKREMSISERAQVMRPVQRMPRDSEHQIIGPDCRFGIQ